MKLIGNEKARQQLVKMLPEAKTILLSGPEGVGKFLAARQAALLVADQTDCIEHRGSLSVDFARDIRESAGYKPYGSKGRAYVLECDTFSPEAMNALLNVLEEPPPNTYFFLVSSAELPSTIVSRCQQVRFTRMTHGEVMEALVAYGLTFVSAERVADAESVGQALAEMGYENARTNVTTYLHAVHVQDMEMVLRGMPGWGEIEVSLLKKRILSMAASSSHQQEFLEIAYWLGQPASCAKLTLTLMAHTLMQKGLI